MIALFVFCEGAHDAELLKKLLPYSTGSKRFTKSLDQYPKPFPGFWRKRLEDSVGNVGGRAAGQLGRLGPPWLEASFRTDDVLYMLFNMGSKDNWSAVADILTKWRTVTATPFGHAAGDERVTSWAAAVVVDADAVGIEQRRAETIARFIEAKLLTAEPLPAASWVGQDGHALGWFVVSQPGQNTGAIEELWLPIAELRAGDLLNGAREFLKQHKDGTEAGKAGREGKAALTIVGQVNHPGDSLAVILRDASWAKAEDVAAHDICRALLAFVQEGVAFVRTVSGSGGAPPKPQGDTERTAAVAASLGRPSPEDEPA